MKRPSFQASTPTMNIASVPARSSSMTRRLMYLVPGMGSLAESVDGRGTPGMDGDWRMGIGGILTGVTGKASDLIRIWLVGDDLGVR